MQLFQNISYLDLGEGEIWEAWASCCGGCRAVARVRGSQVESKASRRKMLFEILDLSVVTVFRSLSAVGSWEEVLLLSMDFTVSQNFLEFVLQDGNLCLKKLAFAFLTACKYWFQLATDSFKTTHC